MSAPRWMKLARDFKTQRNRMLMIVAALAVGIYAVATIAVAYQILTREIARNYLSTNPASILIDMDAVDPATVAALAGHPDIAAAEAGAIVTARVELRPREWVRLLIFVIPDFNKLTINKVFPQQGDFPPPEGALLLEREALAFLGARVGGSIRIQAPGGPKTSVVVAGTVHDPSLAPAWQEQTAYGYLTPVTLAALGGSGRLDLVKLVVREAVHDQARVDDVAARVALDLKARGVAVHQVQAPPTGRHPHQTQMTAVLTLFLIFAALALILAATLTATMIEALLAREIRQIAAMKAIGARSSQIAGLYLAGVLALAAVAAAVGVLLGIASGATLSDIVAQLLNFDIESHGASPGLIIAVACIGLALPAALAFAPIHSTARRTVQEALADFGVKQKQFGSSKIDRLATRFEGFDRTLILALRNSLRRRGRLLLTLALLGSAGGMFVASLSVEKAWLRFIALSAQERAYDLELRFEQPAPRLATLAALESVEGVVKAESWSVTSASPARADGLSFSRAYPDGGHANLDFRAMPNADSLKRHLLLEGAWSNSDDVVILNQAAQFLLGSPHVGDQVTLNVENHSVARRISGIVRQIVTLPAVYASTGDYEETTGQTGETTAIRIVTRAHDPVAVAKTASQIEARLALDGIQIRLSTSEAQVDGAVAGHVRILVVSLACMAVLMALVGLLGLASALAANVAERKREYGIMRSIGATNDLIIRNIIIAAMSLAPALLIAAPLASLVGRLVGTLSFGLPLPLILDWRALGAWTLLLAIGSFTASLAPAKSAARLSIRETLAYL